MSNNSFAPITIGPMEVTRTYLEMRAPTELLAARNPDPLIKIAEQPSCSIDLFRFLYRGGGKNCFWTGPLPLTDEEIRTYLQRPEVSLWVMTYDDEIAGY